MKKLAIVGIAATVMAITVSLPRVHAQTTVTFNPQGMLKPDPFRDVPSDHWAYNAVEKLRREGLTEGFPDGTYKGKRPMTRYEFARFLQLLLQALEPRFATLEKAVQQRGGVAPDLSGLATKEDVEALKNQMLTREQVQAMIDQAMGGLKPQDISNLVTKDQLATIQNLVNEFKNELAQQGLNISALQKELAELKGRVEAIEAELARMPRIHGEANVIFKGGWKSPQTAQPGAPPFRPVLDQDGRPLAETTNVLTPVLPYYDLDLGITARPTSDVRVGAILNVGNYLSSYNAPLFHRYTSAGSDVVTPVQVFATVPGKVIGASEITIGRQTAQLTPFTFKAVDPDLYTALPREDNGNIIFWGAQTAWRLGSARIRAFGGVNPLDGRLQSVNLYPEAVIDGLGNGLQSQLGDFSRLGAAPIGSANIGTSISNFVGARIAIGEPAGPVLPGSTREVAVETTPAAPPTPTPSTETAAEPTVTDVESGYSFGPFRNASVGLNYLMAVGSRALNAEGVALPQDARAQVYGADAHMNLWGFKLGGEVGFGESQTGRVANRPRSLADTAIDANAAYALHLGSLADLELGGGWRRIELGYLVPGSWGRIGSWKNPRGIVGWTVQAGLPIKRNIASFLGNVKLTGSAEFYEGAENTLTVGATPGVNDPRERNLRINRYMGGVQFLLTARNPIFMGVEQVLRNYVPGSAGDVALSLPTMGVAGTPLIGTRIKNTETYINFGIGHNFTSDVQLALLYQVADFEKFAVDNSNQPANYRGYVATAQVGVRF